MPDKLGGKSGGWFGICEYWFPWKLGGKTGDRCWFGRTCDGSWDCWGIVGGKVGALTEGGGLASISVYQ